KESVSDEAARIIEVELQHAAYINSTVYVDKKTAAEIFVKETGEDFRKILDYNPLPASFRIFLKQEYAHQDSIENIIAALSKINGVDEVVYQHQFINKILTQLKDRKSTRLNSSHVKISYAV